MQSQVIDFDSAMAAVTTRVRESLHSGANVVIINITHNQAIAELSAISGTTDQIDLSLPTAPPVPPLVDANTDESTAASDTDRDAQSDVAIIVNDDDADIVGDTADDDTVVRSAAVSVDDESVIIISDAATTKATTKTTTTITTMTLRTAI
jgi:hypothetical protein